MVSPISTFIVGMICLITVSIWGWSTKRQATFDFNNLKQGNRFQKRWLKNPPWDLHTCSYLIVFLSQTASYCKFWVPFLNMMQAQKQFPQVLGILPNSEEVIKVFTREHKAKFNIISMDKLPLNYMADISPIAVLVENGLMVSKWTGEINRECFDQIQQSSQGGIRKTSTPLSQVSSAFVETSVTLTEPAVIIEKFVEQTRQLTHSLRANSVQFDNFLTPAELVQLLTYVEEQESSFERASTTTGEKGDRSSLVLYSFPEFSNLIKSRIQTLFPHILSQLNLPFFDIASIESQITAHNDGDYYRIHRDNGSSKMKARVLTYVYYFNQTPKAFTGGELLLYDSQIVNNNLVPAKSFQTVEPRNNSIVFFLSRHFHEVLPVNCPSRNFADSRFTINGWIRY